MYLADILDYVRPKRGVAKHVVFDGGDSLPNGPYGTSQRLSWAANKDKGMLIGKQLLKSIFSQYLRGYLSLGYEWLTSRT